MVPDFCDYFLLLIVKSSRVPLECRCAWWRLNEVRRNDVDFSSLTEELCLPFEERIRRLYRRKPFSRYPCVQPPCDGDGRSLDLKNRTVRKSPHEHDLALKEGRRPLPPPAHSESLTDSLRLFDWLVSHNFADISHILPQILGPDSVEILREKLAEWKSLGKAEKVTLARKLVTEMRDSAADTADDDDYYPGEELTYEPPTHPKTRPLDIQYDPHGKCQLFL